MIPNVLAIAGVDPSGGAGVLADVKTISALRCYGMAVVTALTAQNTRGVRAIETPQPAFVAAEIDAIFEDVAVASVKIGMVATGAIAAVVAERIAAWRPPFVVLDPVLAASSGDALGASDVADAIVAKLLPLVDLVTPNAPEAARLTGSPEPRDLEGQRDVARRLLAMGARAVLVKGGHVQAEEARDLLVTGTSERVFAAPFIATRATHGTGCALSSAIAAGVARGLDPPDAIAAAKAYVTGAIRHGAALNVGAGHGPIHHFWSMQPGAEL